MNTHKLCMLFFVFMSSFHANPTPKPIRLITKITYYNSFHSPNFNPNATLEDYANDELKISRERLTYFKMLTRNNLSSEKIEIEIIPGGPPRIFFVHLYVGLPRTPQLLVMDTGSSVPWIMCRPYRDDDEQLQVPNLYDPEKSSTYAQDVYCNTFYCINSGDANMCGPLGECNYRVKYPSGWTIGKLGTERFATTDGCLSAISIAKESKATVLGTVIGIDLGTTYSRVGVYKDADVPIIAEPSWVAFSDTERLIGEAAKNHTAIVYGEKSIFFYARRLIGRKFEDKEVQRDVKFSPYKIVNKDGKPYIEIEIKDRMTKVFSAEEITAMFLNKMKETAEAFLGKKIKNAVVTVPAYYNDVQRQATKEAGIMAGLRVASILSEPAAAAIAYALHRGHGEIILVFDLGGGTFDVSILKVDNGVFKVIATSGDANLGGKDLDQRIMEYFIKLIRKKQGKDISKNNKALVKLRRECERAKIALTSQFQVQVEIESLFDDGVDFSEPLTSVQFEELNKDLFNKTMEHVKKAMEDAGLEKHQIDEIVLVGGGSMIPKVQHLLKDYFDGKELKKLDPDETVVDGAAKLGAYLSADRGDDDEIIYPVLHQLEPLSLGVGTAGGMMTKLIPIPTNSVLPMKKSRVFTTRKDNQTRVTIGVYEGESRLTKFCRLLGRFDLTGIPPAPRGTPRIKVTFELDVDTNLNVKAEDKRSEKSEKITIQNVWNIWSQEEMDRMIHEAMESAKEHRKIKERIDAFDNLETYLCETANQIYDKYKLADKLESSGEKEKIETVVREALEWLANNQNAEKENYQQKLKEVEAVCNPIITSVYQTSGGAPRDDH